MEIGSVVKHQWCVTLPFCKVIAPCCTSMLCTRYIAALLYVAYNKTHFLKYLQNIVMELKWQYTLFIFSGLLSVSTHECIDVNAWIRVNYRSVNPIFGRSTSH